MFKSKQTAKRKADALAYHVPEGKDEDAKFWRKIGRVYTHGDGEGFTVLLDVIPVGFDGRITIRRPKPKVDSETGEVAE